jgi:hypothetical protein
MKAEEDAAKMARYERRRRSQVAGLKAAATSATLPATSWPLPQARLAVDLGGPDYGLARDDNGRMGYG